MNLGHFDVVVIGSGALGSSTAFHLAAAGRTVCLVDQAAIASQTSARAAGLSGQVRQTEAMTRLAVHAVNKIRKFEEETGEPLEYFQPGSLSLARLPEDAKLLHERVTRGQKFGVDVNLISPQAASDMMPFLRTKGIAAVSYTSTDVYLEPIQIPLGYARAAQRRGATLMPDTTVHGVVDEKQSTLRVLTDRGELLAGAVVDAAGGWVGRVAKMANWDMPVVPVINQLFITNPIDGVQPNQPITRILDANICVRPDQGGLLLGGYEKLPTWIDMKAVSPGFRVDDLALDIDILRRLADNVAEQLPVFQSATIREHRGGVPTMTADGHHIVGAVPGMGGFYVIGGCNVGGLSISTALGEQLAELIVRGATTFDIADMAPGRFATRMSEVELKERCRQRYASYYTYRFADQTHPRAA